MSQLLHTVRETGVAASRLEKRPVEAETPTKASESEHVLPPPPPPPTKQFLLVPTAPPVVGLYEILTPGMPMGVLFPS